VVFRFVLALGITLSSALAAATPARAISDDVVISQIYGGGGNSGATLTNDFIELFNRGSTPVSLSGWTVQYASAAGSSWQQTALTGTLQPGQYYLVQEAAGAGGTTPLPTPDASGGIAMSSSSGKVALVTSTMTLPCGADCWPTHPAIRDFVGYGSSATDFEGSGPTSPNLSNTTATFRAQSGCTDTDSNAADFANAAPTPRNTASASNFCSADQAPAVATVSPANGANDLPSDTSIRVTFTEAVNVAADWFTLTCSLSGAHAATSSGGPTTFVIDPAVDFDKGESCTLTVVSSKVTDQDALDPPDTMQADFVSTFSTLGNAARIREIQGTTHISPLVGRRVAAVPGVVTGLRGNGFYMQDPSPDADVATSEGIFVFTQSAPSDVSVGNQVSINGTVAEFRPGGVTSNNLTITQLTAPAITVAPVTAPLPSPTVIGRGGRLPPTTVIEDDASGSVETSGVFDPATDGIDFYESLEAMLVRINSPVASGPTNGFGEIWVLPDGGARASVRTSRGGIVIRANDFNPERVLIDDEVIKLSGGSMPQVHVGAELGSVDGILDFDFSNFRVEVKSAPAVLSNTLARESTTPQAQNRLSVGTFNVENLDANESVSKFATLAGLIVNNMKAPDLVTLEEVQDNNGATNDGTVDPSQTLARLISAIQAAGGPTYEFRQINPVNNQDGGEPGGNIRVVFLYRTDRGLSFVDRPGGGSTTPVSVVTGPNGPELSASPGRIDPTNAAFNSSRKPLAGEFLFNGHRLFVVGNHMNSKGGDQPLFGRFQPPTRVTEAQRHQQADIVHDFVASILAADPQANVIVLGDINDFEFSETMQVLTAGDILTPLMNRLPQRERYSYVFEGNSQSLDHIIVSKQLLGPGKADYDVIHVNAEFHDHASDHDPQVARFTLLPGALRLNGRNGYADTPHAADLNPSGDWTVETWFRDDGPFHFNHEPTYLLNKGDAASPESPYFLRLGLKHIVAGVRAGGVDHTVEWNLWDAEEQPLDWHHVAATFVGSTRTLKLYFDGVPVAERVLPASSTGNTLPLQIGRAGPVGDYFQGDLDDIRVWSVARSASEIIAAYQTQIVSAPDTLVANWKLDERDGSIAEDSAGDHQATLHGGARFIGQGHP